MSESEPTLYDLIGGEAKLRALVDRFYDVMDSAPEAQGIRRLHPPTLDSSRQKLFYFLSGWTGGPPLYWQTYGHPRLRARHFPFPIGEAERDQWVWCMRQAIESANLHPALADFLLQRLSQTAEAMRNVEETKD